MIKKHTFLPIAIPHAKPRVLVLVRRLAALLELVVARPLARRVEVGKRVAVDAEDALAVPALGDGRSPEPAQLAREALQVVRLPEEERAPRDEVREVVAYEVCGGGGRGYRDGRGQQEEEHCARQRGGGEHGFCGLVWCWSRALLFFFRRVRARMDG